MDVTFYPLNKIGRIRREPFLDKYILNYADEVHLRMAELHEVPPDLREKAFDPEIHPPGGLGAPLVAQIAVTPDCNLACGFCYAELEKAKRVMRAGEIKTVIDTLYRNGIFFVEWAGGEPLLRREFLELAEYAHGLGFQQSMITNGTRFTPAFCEKAKVFFHGIQMSLDAVGPKYDQIKGGKFWSDFEKGVRLTIQYDLPVICSVCVTKENVDDLEEVVGYVVQSGIKRVRLSWVVSQGKADVNKLETYVELMRIGRRKVLELKRKFGDKIEMWAVHARDTGQEKLPREFLLCPAGRSRIHIDWDGSVYPCPIMKEPEFRAGNILEQSFDQVWHSKELQTLRDVKNGKECNDCKLFCSYWCRALTYGFTRDIAQTPSPVCPYHNEHARY